MNEAKGLWVAFTMDIDPHAGAKAPRIAARSWDRGEIQQEASDAHYSRYTDRDAAAEFGWWMIDHGYTRTEAGDAWKELTTAMEEEIIRESRQGFELDPCPCCGKSEKLGLKPCMTEPDGPRCCPWVCCGECGYSGPPGREDTVAAAVARWQAGDIDLISYYQAKADISEMTVPSFFHSLLSGSEADIISTPDAYRKDLLTAIADQLARISRRCRDLADTKCPSEE